MMTVTINYFQRYLVVNFVAPVGLGGLEPPTSSLSGKRSNQAELQAHSYGVVRVSEAT